MHATRAKVWAPRRTYLRIPSWDHHGKWTVYLMLNPRTGDTLSHVGLKWNQTEFLTLLEKVAARAWLEKQRNITIIPLPSYCSSLNAVESVWRQLRRSVTNVHTFKTMQALHAALETWLQHCAAFPLEALQYARLNASRPQIHLQVKAPHTKAASGARLCPA